MTSKPLPCALCGAEPLVTADEYTTGSWILLPKKFCCPESKCRDAVGWLYLQNWDALQSTIAAKVEEAKAELAEAREVLADAKRCANYWWFNRPADLKTQKITDYPAPKPCGTCGGSGVIVNPGWRGEHGDCEQEPCPDCAPEPCGTCIDGSGVINVPKHTGGYCELERKPCPDCGGGAR